MTKLIKTCICGKCEDKDIPFVAYSNSELEDKPPIGKTIKCKRCGKRHKIEYPTDKETGEESTMLGLYKCGGDSYLASIKGQDIR